MYESPEMAEKQWTSKKGVDGLLHCVCPKQCNICWGEGWWIVDTFFTNLKTWQTQWICDVEILTSSSLASILSACHKQWYLFMNCTKFPFPYLKSKEWHIDFTYCYFMTDIYPNNMFNIIQSFKGWISWKIVLNTGHLLQYALWAWRFLSSCFMSVSWDGQSSYRDVKSSAWKETGWESIEKRTSNQGQPT